MAIISIVTGGTSGIGRAIVRKLIAESNDPGDRVFAAYGHNDALAEELKAELDEGDREKLILVKADLSDYAGIETIREAVNRK